jgi:alpha-tubulin suppressor-like RCC1 family protein
LFDHGVHGSELDAGTDGDSDVDSDLDARHPLDVGSDTSNDAQSDSPSDAPFDTPGDVLHDGESDSGIPSGGLNVACGRTHSCAILEDSSLWCWGNDVNGALGRGFVGDPESMPVSVAVAGPWLIMDVGQDNGCTVHLGDELFCWGDGNKGQLALGDTEDRSEPTAVDDATWSTVAMGDEHACGVRIDGTLWCWGRNQYGQLGLGDMGNGTERLVPTQVGLEMSWNQVAGGNMHTCATKTDGTLWCWGRCHQGQLGIGVSGPGTEQTLPVQVGADTDWAQVSLGNDYTCAVKTSGALLCWGDNLYGGLGIGDWDDRDVPTLMDPGSSWLDLAVGEFHTCGVRSDNSLWCWGRNLFGQLGLGDIGDDTNRSSPEALSPGRVWRSVSAGFGHSCAIGDDGSLWCWGRNDLGQLGVGDFEPRTTPASVMAPEL